MKIPLEPQSYGLHPRTRIEQVAPDTIAIIIERKSRIIMTDGKKILAKAEKIKEAMPGCKVMVKTSAPVCSKTLQYLAANGIILNKF